MSAAKKPLSTIVQLAAAASFALATVAAAMAQDRAARPGDEQSGQPAAAQPAPPQSQGAESQGPSQRAASTRAADDQRAPDQAEGPIITDADRVRWLAAKLQNVAALDEFAAKRISNRQVSQFAENATRQLKQQAALLEQAAEQRSQEAWVAAREQGQSDQAQAEPDLSETIEDIGEAVRGRMQQRADRRENAAAAQASNVQEAADRSADGDKVADNDDARRRRVRERLGVLLPAVREELPELLALLGEAIEDEGSGPAAWVGHQNRVDERILQAKQDELARYDGDRFDQAYLGMRLVTAIEVKAASEVVAQNTDQTLHELLAGTAELLQQQAGQCRQLMDQQYQSRPRVAAGSDDHAAQHDGDAANAAERK